MDLRTDRIGVLADQLESSLEFSKERLAGISDEEFLWEPAQGAWSVRRRNEVRTTSALGAGDWVVEIERPEPSPAPLTTIAWRTAHLHSGIAGRYEWTFGAKAQDPDTLVDFSPSTEVALPGLWDALDQWIHALTSMSDEDAGSVGLSQYPHGLDAELPFIGIVWWTNREVIHHLAEVALLRDLWGHRQSLR